MFYQVYYINIFSFSFLYFSSIANVIALSMLYLNIYNKHHNKHSNLQFNVKAILKKNVLLFWYLDNVLEKYKTGLPHQINIT